jgi:hypothetical protein
MIGIVRSTITQHLRIDASPPLQSVLQALQDQDATPLASNEPIAIFVEGATGPLRLIVVGGIGSPHAKDSQG